MVQDATPNLPHKFHLGSSLESIPTKKGKVLEIIKDYGECSLQDLVRELIHYKITKKDIQNIVRDLKNPKKNKDNKALVQSVRRGWYRYGVTIGVVQSDMVTPKDAELISEVELFRWLSEALYFHNVRGTIENSKFNKKLWGKLQESKAFPLKRNKGTVKIIRNYDTLQFSFVCKRPGFRPSGLIEAIGVFTQACFELNIQGTPIVKMFEARNSRRIVIPELIGLHFRMDLIGGLVAKAYQEPEELQTEIEFNNLQYEFDDFLNAALNLKTNLQHQEAISIIKNKADQSIDLQNILHQTVIHNTTKTEKALQQVIMLSDEANTKLKSTSQYSEYIDSRLFELSQNMMEVKNNQVVDDLKTGFDLLVEKIQFLENKIIESEKETKLWRDMDTQSRLQAFQEFQQMGDSFQTIADKLGSSSSTIWKFAKENDMVTPKENDMVTPKENDMVTPQNIKLSNAVIRFIKNNQGCNNKSITSHLKKRASSIIQILRSLERQKIIENQNKKLGQRGYSWRIRQNG